MASQIKLLNANGKALTLPHQDTHNYDNVNLAGTWTSRVSW